MKKIFASVLSLLIFAPFIIAAQTPVPLPPRNTTDNPPVSTDIGINNPFPGVGDCSGQGQNCLLDFVEALVSKLILPIGSIIAVCMFIWTGFMFVSAQGNPGAIGKAKQSLLYTSIGTAILLGAWVIAEVIKTTVNELSTAAGH